MKLKLNKFSIERDCIPPVIGELNSKGKPILQKLYMDLNLKGFGLLVGRKKKTFIAQYDIRGRTTRVTIGQYGVWTVDQARKKAKELLVIMANGENPNKIKRIERSKTITLGEAAELYLNSPKMLLERSPRTSQGYSQALNCYLKNWLNKPLTEISRKMVRERHLKIGNECGHYAANGTMRAFRAFWNRAMKEYEYLPVCPTINVDWFPEYRRQKPIPVEELPEWYNQVLLLRNPIRRDYLLFVLFSGLRRNDAATIRWENVNLEAETLFRPNPKGGRKRAFTVPLSDFLSEILVRRKDENEAFFPNSPWVFPAQSSTGHLMEPKEKTIKWSCHRLRDTYTTAANGAGLSPYDIETLTNHRPPKSSVTAGYINQGIEQLRESQQKVTDYLLGIINLSNIKRLNFQSMILSKGYYLKKINNLF
jgi:integrase